MIERDHLGARVMMSGLQMRNWNSSGFQQLNVHIVCNQCYHPAIPSRPVSLAVRDSFSNSKRDEIAVRDKYGRGMKCHAGCVIAGSHIAGYRMIRDDT